MLLVLFGRLDKPGQKMPNKINETSDSLIFIADTQRLYDRMLRIIQALEQPNLHTEFYEIQSGINHTCNPEKKAIIVTGAGRWQVLDNFFYCNFLGISADEYHQIKARIIPPSNLPEIKF